MSNYLKIFKDINTFIFDVDGVLTDGSILAMNSGELVRTMNIKDGYALQLAVKKGFKIIILTGGSSKGVGSRLEGLGVTEIYAKISKKIDKFNELVGEGAIDPEKTLFMGDDMPDYNVMKQVVCPCSPRDACNEIKEISMYISDKDGGKGCVRDIIEKVLKAQGKWMLDGDFDW